jgi:hypothetical protein
VLKLVRGEKAGQCEGLLNRATPALGLLECEHWGKRHWDAGNEDFVLAVTLPCDCMKLNRHWDLAARWWSMVTVYEGRKKMMKKRKKKEEKDS